MSAYPHPQLVRVTWMNPRNGKYRAFVAGVTAYDDEDAEDIAWAVYRCMVPPTLLLRTRFQVSHLGREVTANDGTNKETPWRTIWKGVLGG